MLIQVKRTLLQANVIITKYILFGMTANWYLIPFINVSSTHD